MKPIEINENSILTKAVLRYNDVSLWHIQDICEYRGFVVKGLLKMFALWAGWTTAVFSVVLTIVLLCLGLDGEGVLNFHGSILEGLADLILLQDKGVVLLLITGVVSATMVICYLAVSLMTFGAIVILVCCGLIYIIDNCVVLLCKIILKKFPSKKKVTSKPGVVSEMWKSYKGKYCVPVKFVNKEEKGE